LYQGLEWVVFEPNDEPLWVKVRLSVADFLDGLWRRGALQGTKPQDAWYVRCDRTTMTQDDIDRGRLIAEIGFAPLKPAEFVVFRIGLWTAAAAPDDD
jgi:phage tail sheath protein FI